MNTAHKIEAAELDTPTPAQIAAVMNCRNWTGLTLAQLIDAGRIDRTDTPTVLKWTAAALGEIRTVDDLLFHRALARAIATA